MPISPSFWKAYGTGSGRSWRRARSIPLTKELIYIAVSVTNGCSYCTHSHTAAARAKGLSPEQEAEFLAVLGMAAQTNQLVTALQVPVDAAFQVET